MVAIIVAQTSSENHSQTSLWQMYPEDIDAYRLMLLAEENRLRPWSEMLFCQLRVHEESDEALVSRLFRGKAPWAEPPEAQSPATSGPCPLTLHTMLRSLSSRSRSILLLHYRGMTQRDIAKRYGISTQRVSQIVQAALRKVRKKYHS